MATTLSIGWVPNGEPRTLRQEILSLMASRPRFGDVVRHDREVLEMMEHLLIVTSGMPGIGLNLSPMEAAPAKPELPQSVSGATPKMTADRHSTERRGTVKRVSLAYGPAKASMKELLSYDRDPNYSGT